MSGKASNCREMPTVDKQRSLLLECYESVGLRFMLESIAHTSARAFGPEAALEFYDTRFRARLKVTIRQETKGWMEDKAEYRLERETGCKIDHLKELGIITGWFSDGKDETGVMKAVAKKLWDRVLINTEFALSNPANAIILHPDILHITEVQNVILHHRNTRQTIKWKTNVMKPFQKAEEILWKIGLDSINWSSQNMKEFIIEEAKSSEHDRQVVREVISEMQTWLVQEEVPKNQTTLTSHVFHELKRRRLCRKLERMGFKQTS